MAAQTAIQVEIGKAIKPLSERLIEYGNNFIEEHDKLSERVEALDNRQTTTADHIATELGKLETRTSEQGHSTELIHNKIELLESRFAGVEKNLAILAAELDQFEALIKAATLPPPEPALSELYKALVKAQLEIKNAEALIDNEFTHKKYADLAAVMNAVRGPLAKNGLAIIQLTADGDSGLLGIKTILAHISGATIEDVITMHPEKSTPQGVGSCRTYMRRYAVLAMCGIAGAVDDDAEGTKKGDDDYERINSQEAEAIIVKADELFGDRADAALAKMLDRLFGGIQRVGDIKAGEAEVAVTSLVNAAKLMAKTAAKKEEIAKQLAEQEKADKAEHDEKGQ